MRPPPAAAVHRAPLPLRAPAPEARLGPETPRRIFIGGLLAAASSVAPGSSAIAAVGALAAVQTFSVESSPRDPRSFRGLLLPNGLRVLLCSDPTAKKAAAAMDVQVGCFSDPRELPGLAHFCEHMLFLGTERFPVEGDFERFVSAAGGSNNARAQLLVLPPPRSG